MNPMAVLLSFISLLNVAIGLYVLRKNPTEPSHRAFAMMAATIAVWTIGIAGAHYLPLGNTVALRLAFAAGSLIPIGILSFVQNTPRHYSRHWYVTSRILVPMATVLSIASFSSLIVVSASSGSKPAIAKTIRIGNNSVIEAERL